MTIGIVIPCYNEASRLDARRVSELADLLPPGSTVLTVDDGSTDSTAEVLSHLAASDPRIAVLALHRNRGKAEAARQGLLALLDRDHEVVGFTDADFATPVDEVARLAHVCADGDDIAVLGSRVALLGHHIERTAFRHYTGRVFGTIGSLVLGFEVYDTQCGAKFFTTCHQLRHALSAEFHSRWSFDVELLGRLATPSNGLVPRLREVPLREWHDVDGSKLTLSGSLRATLDLWTVRRALRRWHRAG